jgi:NADH:ubiquinone oxidoreductase subunit K
MPATGRAAVNGAQKTIVAPAVFLQYGAPYWELTCAYAGSAFGVILAGLWLFRTRRDGARASLASRMTRLELSSLIVLLVPCVGTFPLAYILFVVIPQQMIEPEAFTLLLIAVAAAEIVVGSGIIYLLLSAALWIEGKTQKVE